MDRQQIISHLRQDCAQLGIPGLQVKQVKMSAHSPLEIDMAFGGKDLRLLCEVKSDARSITIERAISQLQELRKHKGGENVKPCLVVPFLPKSARDKLRSKNISFIDLSGNIYINDPGLLHIEREGRDNVFSDSQVSGNIFADKRSLVIRYLFAYPKKFVGVREIAKACGANPGGVSVALKLLKEAGYIARNPQGQSKLTSWRELLEDWAAYYKLKKQKESRFFWNIPSLDRMLDLLAGNPQQGFALTGHAGAHFVAPYVNYEGLHAYVRDHEVIDKLTRSFKMRQAEKGANVFLIRPYYKASAFFGARNIKGVEVVSDVQLYLDLKNFPVRGEEQAENLLQRVIEPSME
ncbi:type IV toxin-antitoxin system AbiEi family antitoxin [Thermodesulfobacteriota bacterium]